jgi:chromosome partitioning protein
MNGFILTACQRKGGVGRSTLLYCLAGSLAKRGLKTLLIDLDPQASITQVCFGAEITDTLPPGQSVVGLLDPDFYAPPDRIIRPTGLPLIDIMPGSNSLGSFDLPDPEKTGAIQFALRDALADIRGQYDAVLCDTPPSLNSLSWLPAMAADAALTPSPATALAVQELTHTSRFLDRVSWAGNPQLAWLGVVLTLYQPRLAIQNSYAQLLRDSYGQLVLETPMPFNVAFQECVAHRKPLAQWKPKSAPAKAVDALTNEILDRISRLRGKAGEAA